MTVLRIGEMPTDKLTDTKITRKIGELDKLTFELPNDLREYVDVETPIQAEFGNFIVKEYRKNGRRVLVDAIGDVTELEARYHATPDLAEGSLQEKFARLLEGTGWRAAGSYTGGNIVVAVGHVTAYDGIVELAKRYGVEVRFDTVRKRVRYGEKLGEDRGSYFAEDLNLKEIEEQGESYNLITRIIPEGANGLGIQAVNGGRDYLENTRYRKDGITLYWKDERYTNLLELKREAQRKLDELSTPRVVFDVKVEDLSHRSKYDILAYDIGDTVKVISRDIVQKHRVVECELYPDDPKKNVCKLSTRPTTMKEIFEEMDRAQEDQWSKTEVTFEILSDRIVQAVTTNKKYTDDSFETYKAERVHTDQEIRETISHSTTYVDPVTGQTRPVRDKLVETVKNLDGVKTTAENAKSKAEQAITADSYTRSIANKANETASSAKQTADLVEYKFQNYSPDRVKYGSTYALTPSECYIAYNGTKTFRVSAYDGEVTLGGYGAYLKASDDRIEVKGLRTEGNVTMLGNLIMQGQSIFNGGLAINFAYGTKYPIEMHQGVECMNGLYVHGAKSATQDTSDGTRAVYCYETADNYFGDLGFGEIGTDGECVVAMDPIFVDLVNTRTEYIVQLNPEGAGELYTAEKHPAFFVVKGTPGMRFSWEVKAKRKHYDMKRLDRVDSKKEKIGAESEEMLLTAIKAEERERASLLSEEAKRFEESYRRHAIQA